MLKAYLRTQRNYGRDDVYIVNEEVAKAVRQLTGKATVNKDDIQALQDLGIMCTFGIDGHGYHIPQTVEAV